MSLKKHSDEAVISAISRFGVSGAATELGVDLRQLNRRRRTIEKHHQINVVSGGSVQVSDYSPRHHIDIPNGQVVVFSDAHFWPGQGLTTANRALLAYLKLNRGKVKAVVCNGDAFDGASVSRWPSSFIDMERRPSVKMELEACEDRLNEIALAADGASLIWPMGNHDCLDMQTECLTKRGWVHYPDILPTDEILSLDGDSPVWTGINERLLYPFDGELIRIEKRDISMAVTENHRVLINAINWREKAYTNRKYVKADQLPYSFTIPVSGESRHQGSELSDDELMLAGWVLTDGGIESNGAISIWQSKPDKCVRIQSILDRIGLKYSIYMRQRDPQIICGTVLLKPPMDQYQYRLTAESSRSIAHIVSKKGFVPAWGHSLTGHQFDVFLGAVVDGDGTWDGADPSGKTVASVYGTYEFLSSLQSVAVQHGWRARVSEDNRGNFVLRLCKTDNLRIGSSKRDDYRERYVGNVWCLRVPHGNFMVRRNGSAYFTGNCRFECKLAASAPEFNGVSGFSLHDRFPLWTPCWSTWINDTVVVKHTFRAGIHGGYNSTLHSGKTTVTGHTHQLDVRALADYNGTRWGIQTGCLADPYGPQFDYTQDNPRSHNSGFAVLTFINGRLAWPEVVRVVENGLVEFRGREWEV